MRIYKRNWKRRDSYAIRQKNMTSANKCPDMTEYIGNIFLLGLTTLVGEIIDLQAANALEVLLEPFQNKANDDVEQDVLAGNVEDGDVIDLLDGLL